MEDINVYNRSINGGVLDTQELDGIINEYECQASFDSSQNEDEMTQ
jgi:hypothetical protein